MNRTQILFVASVTSIAALLSPISGAVEVAPSTAPAATRPLSRTVGVDIVKKTANPDGSLTLTFQWKDKSGAEESRSVTVNQNTVIGVDGQFKRLSDLTEETYRKKAVAAVGPDGVTAVNLRFGRAMVQVSKDQLTPSQVAALEAAAPPATPASDAALAKRVDGIVASLQLSDPGKETRLKQILSTDLKAVRDSHNAGFSPDSSVRANLNAGLSAVLTPQQIETVKDRLTANKVPVTFAAYHQIVPNLTAEDDAKILDLLKQAREKCLDVKNTDEMAGVFKPYKTQIEHYLTDTGRDWKTLYTTYVDSQKAGGSARTRPAN